MKTIAPDSKLAISKNLVHYPDKVFYLEFPCISFFLMDILGLHYLKQEV